VGAEGGWRSSSSSSSRIAKDKKEEK